MKSILILFSFLIFSSFSFNHNKLSDQFVCNAVELKGPIEKISKIPEIVQKINKITQEGKITVKMQYISNFDFEALWNSNSRCIIVNGSNNKKEGELITSILFELHNAKSDSKLSYYFSLAEKGKIDKESYVRAIEKLEHDNAMETVELLELGIKKGVFPIEARWNIYDNFEDHYKLQQVHGHSQWIADKFDQIAPKHKIKPYKGTLSFKNLSEEDKQILTQYLSIKNRLSSKDQFVKQMAQKEKMEVYNHFSFCKDKGHSLPQCSRHKLDERMFYSIFTK